MGQAIVSPDPLDDTSTATSANADDLLSQLAGEEIDRLLAESETGDRAVEADRGASADEGSTAAEELERVLDGLATPAVKELPLAASHTAAADATPAKPQAADPSAPAPVAAPVEDAPASKPFVEFDSGTGQEERAALGAKLSLAETGAAAAAAIHLDEIDLGEDDAPLPAYLRPLEWLNAPLIACPEGVREALGKVAIVTLVNAIAVLIYVLMFRQ